MIRTKKIMSDSGQSLGWSIIILWLFSVTLSYTIEKGDHITLGFCIGPFEIAVCLSIWRKLLP